jgi:hypothetical protein
MDVKSAKALLKVKEKMGAEAGGDVFKRIALESELSKIPTDVREQAEQQLAQDKLTAAPQKAPAATDTSGESTAAPGAAEAEDEIMTKLLEEFPDLADDEDALAELRTSVEQELKSEGFE